MPSCPSLPWFGSTSGSLRSSETPLSEQERNKALFQCLPRMNFAKVALGELSTSPKGARPDYSSRATGGTQFHFGRRHPSHHMPPAVTRQGQCHHALRSEGPRKPTQKAFKKKKANTMTTNFPKNVTRHRASDMTVTMPLGATFKKREKPNRSVRASGCSSAWQVCCTTHLAGDPP